MNQNRIDADEMNQWRAFKKNMRISDNQSTGEVPHYEEGKWAYETKCDCSTCVIMRA